MANYLGFSSDKIDIYEFLLDKSGSMRRDRENVVRGLELYKKSFENFAEANSIAVSLCTFDDYFNPGEFKPVNNFKIKYYNPDGATALYYSIVKGAEHLKRYISEVTENVGCIPRATFLVLSDGQPCEDRLDEEDGKRAIEELNLAGVTTIFVAFGEGISSDFGKRLGFMVTVDVTDRDTLVNFLGVELSKSCKEQSQSLKALGANFFSQATNNSNSDKYSSTTAQALEDDSWINDI